MTGSGTITDPYVIQNVTDLQNISLNPAAYYILGNNIDCTGFPFTPIPGFLGNLDGQSKQINHLSITTEFNACLFDYSVPPTIANVSVSNITFNDINLLSTHDGNNGIFSLLPTGNLTLSKIILASGNYSGGDNSNVGGLVGFANFTAPSQGLTISQCSSYVSQSCGNASNMGGLIGWALVTNPSLGLTISQSFTYINQTCITNSAVGGLIGIAQIDNNQVVNIINAYARGSIIASSGVGTVLGGIIGEVFDDTPGLTLENVYSTVAVPVGLWRGGLIGYHSGPG